MLYMLVVCLMGTYSCSIEGRHFPTIEACMAHGEEVKTNPVTNLMGSYPLVAYSCKEDEKPHASQP